MKIPSDAGDGRPSLRASGGYVCPRCRYRVDSVPEDQLAHCPEHGLVLVRADILADADGDPFLGMTVGGRFAVLERLGSGSMATVYRARHAAMRRDVALKIVRSDRLLDAQAKRRFEREAHAMSLLTSPHTVTVFDFGEIKTDDDPEFVVDGSLYLAMELLEGESLGTRIKRDGPLSVADALRCARHALRSLAEAHDKGIIHRDLKPDNLVLVPDARGEGEICKLLDFGIAKVLTQAEGVDALETQAGTVFGTPRYMSPEQAQGKPLDARSDLYSLGVILYHMLAGRAPYTDRDAVVVMAHHIRTPPKPLSEAVPEAGVPRGLDDLVMRVLSKDPADRPQTAGEFMRALDHFADEAGIGTGELTAVLALGPLRVPKRHVLLASAAAVVCVIGLAGALLVEGGTESTGTHRLASGLARGVHAQAAKLPTGRVTAVVGEATVSPGPPAAGSGQTDGGSDAAAADTAAPSVIQGPSPTQKRGPPRSPRPRGYERFDRL